MPSDRRHDPADAMRDIMENIDRIGSHTAGMDRAAFERDGKTHDAVERCLQRITEAAHRLGDHASELVPGQPWRDIRGLGNRLRHAYDALDPGMIRDTIRDDLPGLRDAVAQALERLRGRQW